MKNTKKSRTPVVSGKKYKSMIEVPEAQPGLPEPSWEPGPDVPEELKPVLLQIWATVRKKPLHARTALPEVTNGIYNLGTLRNRDARKVGIKNPVLIERKIYYSSIWIMEDIASRMTLAGGLKGSRAKGAGSEGDRGN
ncbi:MAG TPA: hypothetical protein PKV94_07695 [Syntrophales bacterium]|nr:hypothetical protein [Syntrophales bacterium]HPN24872.1 hypothetical protein [Syntrophales bacterium]